MITTTTTQAPTPQDVILARIDEESADLARSVLWGVGEPQRHRDRLDLLRAELDELLGAGK